MEFKLINSTHYDYFGDMLNAILFDLRTKQSFNIGYGDMDIFNMDIQTHKQGKERTHFNKITNIKF